MLKNTKTDITINLTGQPKKTDPAVSAAEVTPVAEPSEEKEVQEDYEKAETEKTDAEKAASIAKATCKMHQNSLDNETKIQTIKVK